MQNVDVSDERNVVVDPFLHEELFIDLICNEHCTM